MDSVISRVVRVGAGRFASGHIGRLTRIVPFEDYGYVIGRSRCGGG